MPPDSPEGLCPRCLIALNLATQTDIPGEPGAVKAPPAPPLPVADVAKLFPQLEILECLGRGGMGAVYKARQPRLDRLVALKILSPEKQGNQKFAGRFEREARALAKLHHPNIVTVFDFGEAGGNFYLLMEFVDGLTLRQLFQARKLSPPEALAIVPKICEALQYAHEQGIVHRDIKPENILMDKDGGVKIADFGIAKILGDGGSDNLTAEQVIGTPHYMSPEQIERPQTVDHRADIYSLGVVFYEMLTGELPLGKFPLPSKKVHIDVRLDEIVLRALEKEPERRYQQASEVKTRIEEVAAQTEKSNLQAVPENKSGIVRIVEIFFDITFKSRLAIILINLSALGFLSFLGFLGYWHGMRWVGFFGFAGFFGLIGVAFVVELFNRRKTSGAMPEESNGPTPAQIKLRMNVRLSRPAIWILLFVACVVIGIICWNQYWRASIRSDYIGQTWFPYGDSIQITSVERTEGTMTVKGHYTLVSHDSATLDLYITSTNTDSRQNPEQGMDISKGTGDFQLTDTHVVPGLPHVSMYADGHSFAAFYFGTKEEAAEESHASWITNFPSVLVSTNYPRVVSVWPADGTADVDTRQDIRIRFDQPMNPNDVDISWLSGGFLTNGEPYYDAAKNEFVVPVQLLAGRTNIILANWAGRSSRGFRNTNSMSADAFKWQFTTMPAATLLDAPKPGGVPTSPPPGQTMSVLTMLELTFDQPMTLDRGLPYLRGADVFSIPAMIRDIHYDSSGRHITVPLLLPPDNETKLTLDGFYSAEGVAGEPVIVRCEIGTNNYSSGQLNDISVAAKDPQLEQLLSSMKAARTRLTSGIETVEWISLSQSKDCLRGITVYPATFKWQGSNQFYEDISDVMGGKAFILGTDGENCWMYSDDQYNGRRLDSSPVESVADIYTSIADPFNLARDSVLSAISKGKLIYDGQTQLDGHPCYCVKSWFVEQTGNETFPVEAARSEWWIDSETYLPMQVTRDSQFDREIFKFHYEGLNQPLPITTFQPPMERGVGPKMDDWYKKELGPDEKFFFKMKDGSDGQISGRIGRRGPNGSTDSGLN